MLLFDVAHVSTPPSIGVDLKAESVAHSESEHMVGYLVVDNQGNMGLAFISEEDFPGGTVSILIQLLRHDSCLQQGCRDWHWGCK
jgi:hypothetical protein